MEKKILKIEQEDNDKIQSIHSVCEVLKNQLSRLIEQNLDNPELLNSKIFLELQDQYKFYMVNYEDLKNKLQEKYCEGIKILYTWSLDYAKGEMAIYFEED